MGRIIGRGGRSVASLVAWLFVSWLGFSCRSFHPKGDRNPSVQPYTSTIGAKRADPHCVRAHAVADVGAVEVWVWDSIWPEKRSFDLMGSSGVSLASDAMRGIKINAVFSSDGTYLKQQNPGEDLYFCRTGGGYPQESLENIALSAAVSIDKVGDLLRAHHVPPLPPITVYLHPQIDPVRRTGGLPTPHAARRSPLSGVDNAYYANHAIYILPHSPVVLDKIYKGIPLWAQLAVISHEYGHYVLDIFALRYRNQPLRSGDELVPLQEAYADLTAYYAFQGTENDLGKLRFGDILQNRNVASCACDDGSVKVLTSRFLSKYFASLNLVGVPPNPEDPHTLGAIIAYGLEAVMEAMVPRPSWEAKFGVLLHWGEALAQEKTIVESFKNQELLGEAIFIGVNSIKNRLGALNQQACEVLKTTFPVYYPDWRKRLSECSTISHKDSF